MNREEMIEIAANKFADKCMEETIIPLVLSFAIRNIIKSAFTGGYNFNTELSKEVNTPVKKIIPDDILKQLKNILYE